ncbi:MAG: amidophosphoribosyltransferase [Bacteroidales bacterium]|nr:amidophosphoribosyltransferase [Bacteroidales bacterium]HHV03829.1 amidophosphoribosyltransferase [Bacteroidales bacterium]
MGGFFGIVSKSPCANTLFYGTDYHSHMGTKRAGLATMNEQGIIKRTIHRIENSYFRNKFEDELQEFTGNKGIGVISDYEPQPIVLRSHLGTFAIVTIGKINNLDELGNELLNRGINFSELSSGQINPTEVVGHLITLGQTFAEGIRLVQERISGSCSMLLLTQDGIIAARDRYGRTPIAIGIRRQNGHSPISSGNPLAEANTATGEITAIAFASESCSFPNLDLQLIGILGPGEAVLAQESPRFCAMTEDGRAQGVENQAHDVEGNLKWRRISEIHPLLLPREQLQICAFLWVYYGFPTSAYEGINVEEVRFRNGVLMGREDEAKVDFVCSIPDSGTGMAMGYAVGKGVPYRQAVAKYTPTWPRSFMPSDKERRSLVARMKLLPNADVLRGARLACCDDSIVRGTQLRNNVDVFYRNGVKEIHVRISCPPLLYKCPYLNFTSTRSDLELITRRYIQAQKVDNLSVYIDHKTKEHKCMVESICKEMNFTSLKYNNIENLIASIGLPKESICTYCFDGSGCGE